MRRRSRSISEERKRGRDSVCVEEREEEKVTKRERALNEVEEEIKLAARLAS